MRDAEPLLRRIEALEHRYREIYLPFSEIGLRIIRDLKLMPEYVELQDTLFEVNLKCPTPSSFEAVERKLLRNVYSCVCEFIEDTRLVVTNVYQYVDEDILAWPAARRIELVMEERFVADLHRPKLHTFVEDRLRDCSQGVVRKIQRVLESYGEVDTPFKNLQHATLQAICRCLPDMNPPIEAPAVAAPSLALCTGAPVEPVAHPQGASAPLPPSPATPAMTTMQQNAHTATFFHEISPVHLSDDSDEDHVMLVPTDNEENSNGLMGVIANNGPIDPPEDDVHNSDLLQLGDLVEGDADAIDNGSALDELLFD